MERHHWKNSTAARFDHVHIDMVGPLPVSKGYRYYLTCVDRYSRWTEAVPTKEIDAETIAATFLSTWIARYGVLHRITTDQGRQFESKLYNELTRLIRASQPRTIHLTAHHPQANGMVERFHRQLKAAIKCHETENWVEMLLTCLKTSAAEIIYDRGIRLSGEFFTNNSRLTHSDFTKRLRENIRKIKPVPGTRHESRKTLTYK